MHNLPPAPGPGYILKINEFGEYEWRHPRVSRKHLAIAVLFNLGAWAFFAWVLWQSIGHK